MKVTINNYVTSGVTVKNKPGQEKINLRIMLSRNITRLPAEREGVASFVGDFTLRLFKQGEEEM